jgi:hypothetical protein
MARIVVTFNEDEFAFLQTTFNDAKTLVRHSPLANATLLALSRAEYVSDTDADDSTTDDTLDPEDMSTWQDSGEFVALDGGQGLSEDESVPPTMGD